MDTLIVDCTYCRQPIRAVKQGKSIVWYSELEPLGPHGCEVVKNGRAFLNATRWFFCRGCDCPIKVVTMGDGKKWAMGTDHQRHRCDERTIPPQDRFWSGDGSYPWEYPVVDGKPILVNKPSDGRKGLPPKYPPFKWCDSDTALLDRVFGPTAPLGRPESDTEVLRK